MEIVKFQHCTFTTGLKVQLEFVDENKKYQISLDTTDEIPGRSDLYIRKSKIRYETEEVLEKDGMVNPDDF